MEVWWPGMRGGQKWVVVLGRVQWPALSGHFPLYSPCSGFTYIPTIFAHFCSAQTVTAFKVNELDLMGALCRAVAKWECQCLLPSPLPPWCPPPPSVVPSCPPQLYVFRSGSGSPDTQLYTTHSFIDSRELLFLEIVCQNTFALPCKFLFLCIVQYKAISR